MVASRRVPTDPRTMYTCNNCGARVSPDFARVFGDNQNDVFGCMECMLWADIQQGKAGGSDRGRTSTDDPS